MTDHIGGLNDDANYAQVPDVERPAHILTPARTASVMTCLLLIRHLVDVKQTPERHFREAQAQLGLTEYFAHRRATQNQRSGPLTPEEINPIAAVLITTYINTLRPEDVETVPTSPA